MNQTPQKTLCPYCRLETFVELPGDYAPVYVHCGSCKKKFIVERKVRGFKSFSLEEAPCISNPDCRDIEMGAADEQ